MLLRIACTRCRLASLWTDDPECFLATVCQAAGRCEATLVDEAFAGAKQSAFDAGAGRVETDEVATKRTSQNRPGGTP